MISNLNAKNSSLRLCGKKNKMGEFKKENRHTSHGFLLLDAEVVAAIVSWIKGIRCPNEFL